MIANTKKFFGLFFALSMLPSIANCYDPSSDDPWALGRQPEAVQRETPPPKQSPRTSKSPSNTRTRSEPIARARAETKSQGDLVPAVNGLPPDPGSASTYRIGPKDLLKVEVFQVPELSSTERVNDSGQIVMSLIGPVSVGGLTPKDAEAHVAALLGRDYLQNPQVDIQVEEYASQRITVMGSVKKPGIFPITGKTTLLQAIALAEGVDPLANEDETLLFRKKASGEMIAYVVDIALIQKGRLRDPILIAEDRVVVPESGSAVFFKGVTDTLRGFVRLPIY